MGRLVCSAGFVASACHRVPVLEYSWTPLIFGPGVHIYLDPWSIRMGGPLQDNGPLLLTHESGDDAKSLRAHTVQMEVQHKHS